MDYLDKITFTHRYWILLLPLVMMAADIVTGWIQASINGTWDSTKMRKGLFRKSGEILVVLLAYVISMAISLPADIPAFFSIYIIIMEVISVTENLDRAGLPVPKWITNRLNKVAKAMTEDDPIEKEDLIEDKQEPHESESHSSPEDKG